MDTAEVLSQNTDRLCIYQCAKCKNVIGNEKFLSKSVNDEKVLYFKEIENCLVHTSDKLSKDTIDYGCRYRKLECCNCHVSLGHYYSKVTKNCIHLEGLTAIHVSEISLTYIKLPSSDNSKQVFELQSRVDILEQTVANLSSKIEDLAVACVEACKDRVGIKEAVANVLMVMSNELEDKGCAEEESNWFSEA